MTRNRVQVTLLALSVTLTAMFIGGSFITYSQPISSSEMQNIYLAPDHKVRWGKPCAPICVLDPGWVAKAAEVTFVDHGQFLSHDVTVRDPSDMVEPGVLKPELAAFAAKSH
jgi:hypothetical protein